MNQPSLDFTTVNKLRDRAMAQVATNAEGWRFGFSDEASRIILMLLESGPQSGEYLTLACKAAGVTPHDDRAFGPVYMRLARKGLIEKVGIVQRRRGHGTSGGNVWQLANAR